MEPGPRNQHSRADAPELAQAQEKRDAAGWGVGTVSHTASVYTMTWSAPPSVGENSLEAMLTRPTPPVYSTPQPSAINLALNKTNFGPLVVGSAAGPRPGRLQARLPAAPSARVGSGRGGGGPVPATPSGGT